MFFCISNLWRHASLDSHFHCLVLEGGFDDEGDFVYIPFSGLKKMTEYFRRKVINLFLKNDMINENFARNLLSWKNSGFSIDNSVQILTDKARVNLSEYISLQREHSIFGDMGYMHREPRGNGLDIKKLSDMLRKVGSELKIT